MTRVMIFEGNFMIQEFLANIFGSRFPSVELSAEADGKGAMEKVENFLPDLVLSGAYAPVDAVDRIAPRPLLLAHGTQDELIPYGMGEALYARAKEPKRFHPIRNGGHLHIPDEAVERAYRAAIVAFFDEALEVK